jgi:hypothetical protein
VPYSSNYFHFYFEFPLSLTPENFQYHELLTYACIILVERQSRRRWKIAVCCSNFYSNSKIINSGSIMIKGVWQGKVRNPTKACHFTAHIQPHARQEPKKEDTNHNHSSTAQ